MKNTHLCILIMLLCFNSIIYSQEKKLDSLITITSVIADSSNIDLATDFIYQLSLDEKYDIALSYSEKFLKKSRSLKYHKGTGRVYIEKANIYNITDASFKEYNKGIAVTNNNKSIIQHRLGNFEKSINLLLEANIYYEKLNDSISLADTFNNIGNVYKSLKQYQLAKKYYKKSIIIKRKNKLKTLGSSLNNLASTHIDIKETDSAITILNESLKESKLQKDSRSISGTYNAFGRIYFDKKNYSKAKEYFEASMFVGGKIEYKSRLIATKHALTSIGIKTNNLTEAEKHLNEARVLSQELNAISHLLVNYKYAAQLDSAKGNFENAYAWQKKYQTLFNEKTEEEKRKNVSIAEQKLKNQQEQQKILEEQRLEEQKTNEKLLLRKVYTYATIAAFIIAIVFILFIIKRRSKRAK